MGSRHAAPLFVADAGQMVPLERLELGRGDDESERREAFIQALVHEHPDIIPMADIEPAMSPLVSVCVELPVAGYAVDNLWITPWGGLIVGECKLVRNPQARREVVAQVLDYAQIMARWTFEDLEQAARQARRDPSFRLWNLIEKHTDLDEAQFVDAVERRLRAGRMLLLVIGDGIQEGVEGLISHLQLHAGIHAGLALLELSLWRGMDGGLLVVPRIPMRTVLVERGVVTLDHGGVVRIAPATEARTPRQGGVRSFTQSETEYFDRLGEKYPEQVEELRSFLESLNEVGVSPEYQKSAVLRFLPSPDIRASAGYIEANGRVTLGDAVYYAEQAGCPEAGHRYVDTLAAATGCDIHRYATRHPDLVDAAGKLITIATLLRVSEVWRGAIGRFVDELKAAAAVK